MARHEPLLLQPAHRLPARLLLLSSALQLPPPAAAELVSASAPQLLGTSLTKLQTNLLQLGRVLGSRGLKPAEVLQARPDLLTQNPRSVEAKLEQLPGALGMPRQRVRQLVSQCPELLRHSVATVSHRCVCVEALVIKAAEDKSVLQDRGTNLAMQQGPACVELCAGVCREGCLGRQAWGVGWHAIGGA